MGKVNAGWWLLQFRNKEEKREAGRQRGKKRQYHKGVILESG